MSKLRNCVFFACTAGLLCCTLGFKCLNKLDIPVPGKAESETGRSYLEGRTYSSLPDFSPTSFVKGDLQDGLESYIADALPFREQLLVGKASLQRISVSQMAGLLGYDVYPTFFGSDYLCSANDDRLFAKPAQATASNVSGLVASMDSINSFSAEHPEYSYYFAMPYRSDILGVGPLEGLVSNQLDGTYLESEIFSRLSPAVTQIDLAPASYEDYDEGYFRTDHHWNIKGAYKAYAKINAAMGNADSTAPCGSLVSFENARFYGSEARAGLDTSIPADEIEDYDMSLPTYTTWVYGKLMPDDFAASTARYADGFTPVSPFMNLYADYWHGDYGQIVFVNEDDREGKSLLIVADSFSNPIERMFLNSYSNVYVYDPRYAKISLSDFLDKYTDIDDILFLESYQTLRGGKAIAQGGAAS